MDNRLLAGLLSSSRFRSRPSPSIVSECDLLTPRIVDKNRLGYIEEGHISSISFTQSTCVGEFALQARRCIFRHQEIEGRKAIASDDDLVDGHSTQEGGAARACRGPKCRARGLSRLAATRNNYPDQFRDWPRSMQSRNRALLQIQYRTRSRDGP
jgi:hypothetical protein